MTIHLNGFRPIQLCIAARFKSVNSAGRALHGGGGKVLLGVDPGACGGGSLPKAQVRARKPPDAHCPILTSSGSVFVPIAMSCIARPCLLDGATVLNWRCAAPTRVARGADGVAGVATAMAASITQCVRRTFFVCTRSALTIGLALCYTPCSLSCCAPCNVRHFAWLMSAQALVISRGRTARWT